VSLEARVGEVLGVAGQAGSGYRDVLAVGCGLVRPSAGEIRMPDGSKLGRGLPAAVRQGVGLVSGDRKRPGLMLDESVWRNVTEVKAVGAARAGPFLRRARMRALARTQLTRLGVRSASVDQAAHELSGGNQQKVVLAKWLAARPRVLLMDDPTRGVDIGAKHDIHRLLRELAERGVAQVVLSSDSQELADVCDRVIVIYHGRVAAELSGDRVTAHEVLVAVNGTQEEPR
jgi:ABC-type sugar transport system ATPase subunit